MGVNLDVDGYTKTLNHRKILRNTQKLLKTKGILKPKYMLSGGPEFYIYCSMQRGQFTPPKAADRPKHSANFQ